MCRPSKREASGSPLSSNGSVRANEPKHGNTNVEENPEKVVVAIHPQVSSLLSRYHSAKERLYSEVEQCHDPTSPGNMELLRSAVGCLKEMAGISVIMAQKPSS